MEILIRNTDGTPIYAQIAAQIRGEIISGKLGPGEALPSIRALARGLKVSVITTKRAYDELEAAGFLHTVAGKGCFVAEQNLDLIRERRTGEMEQHLSAAVETARELGLTREDVVQTLDLLWQEP
ncbi:MAG: GntR family transcriptional regulator [Oscillibacter sp.]|nr:GntR family transcriptional regulator [Oscillibacter sp.]